jgi:hypothetical protein
VQSFGAHDLFALPRSAGPVLSIAVQQPVVAMLRWYRISLVPHAEKPCYSTRFLLRSILVQQSVGRFEFNDKV